MLPFLKEQDQSNNPVRSEANKTRNPQNIGTNQDQEYLTVDNKRSSSKTTYLLAILFIAGLVCLLFMIKNSSPEKASAQNTEQSQTVITKAIAKITGIKSQMLDKMDGIVDKFYEFSDVKQIKVNELSRNPFDQDTFLNNIQGNADQKAKVDAELLRKQQIQNQAEDLHLLSIIQSSRGISCMINDEILYKDDIIKGFKIKKISKNSVTLAWNDEPSEDTNVILKLDE